MNMTKLDWWDFLTVVLLNSVNFYKLVFKSLLLCSIFKKKKKQEKYIFNIRNT